MISAILVDDDIEMLNGLESLICWEEYGFSIAGKAKNGSEALKLVETEIPDVIITDITMPVMGGLELLREARKLVPQINCVIISCHEDFDYAREAIWLEADDYLIKHTLTEEGLIHTLLSLKEKIERKKKLQAAEQSASASVPIPPSDSRAPHSSIKQALNYIDAHLGEEISCKGVADHINMNPSYFSRLFKRETRANFSDYLLQKRIQTATGLLLSSDLYIDEIARVVGFESVSYFYRAYKRITGNTPGVVRGGGK